MCGEWLGSSVDLMLFDRRFNVKAAPTAHNTVTAVQPTTIPATMPWLSFCRDDGVDVLEGLDVIGFVVLDELFVLRSKSSFTAADVHEDGY